jgi:hypothetical protein
MLLKTFVAHWWAKTEQSNTDPVFPLRTVHQGNK